MVAAAVLTPPAVMAEKDDCPGMSPHPAVPRPGRAALRWIEQGRGHGRVVAYTCSCQMTSYELISIAGHYQIRRRAPGRPGTPPVTWTAHCWRREEAYEWWLLLLAGQAR